MGHHGSSFVLKLNQERFMAIIHFSYLFDAQAFSNAVSAMIPELEKGNFQPLYEMAEHTMQAKPELWPLLEDLFLGQPFAEKGEIPSPRRLLMMVMAQFLQPIQGFRTSRAWQLFKTALSFTGWGENDIDLLIFGKPLCDLLVPQRGYNLHEYQNRPQDLPWCAGYTGWLDQKELIRLHDQLLTSKEQYELLAKAPLAVKEALPMTDPGGVPLPLDWYKDELMKAFDEIDRILTTALEARTSLALAVAG
jgi:hypothetical protein